MRFLNLSAIFLTANFIFVVGCGDSLPPFPADYIYVVKPDLEQCSKHKIIKKDPVTVDKGEWVAWAECPHVFGFSQDDAGPVLNWIRNAEKVAKEKCK